MYQKEAAKAAWTAAGLYRSRDPKLRALLKHIESAPLDCWTKIAEMVREKYPELVEQIAAPLWDSGDKLLRVNLVRYLDPARREERDLLNKLVRRLDPQEDGPELAAVARSRTASAIDLVAKRKDVPEAIRVLAQRQLVLLAREAEDKAAEAKATAPPVPLPNPVKVSPKAKGAKRGTTARAKNARHR